MKEEYKFCDLQELGRDLKPIKPPLVPEATCPEGAVHFINYAGIQERLQEYRRRRDDLIITPSLNELTQEQLADVLRGNAVMMKNVKT